MFYIDTQLCLKILFSGLSKMVVTKLDPICVTEILHGFHGCAFANSTILVFSISYHLVGKHVKSSNTLLDRRKAP